jgi:DNA transformation protein and related proteins
MSMATARERALEFADRLRAIGPVSVTRFFGGAGLAKDGVQFAFVIEGTLYLRVDDLSRPDFEALDAAPFTYTSQSKTVKVASYYELPDQIADDGEALVLWAIRAVHAAAVSKPKTAYAKSRQATKRAPRSADP